MELRSDNQRVDTGMLHRAAYRALRIQVDVHGPDQRLASLRDPNEFVRRRHRGRLGVIACEHHDLMAVLAQQTLQQRRLVSRMPGGQNVGVRDEKPEPHAANTRADHCALSKPAATTHRSHE